VCYRERRDKLLSKVETQPRAYRASFFLMHSKALLMLKIPGYLKRIA
jgi:hypothetical protein